MNLATLHNSYIAHANTVLIIPMVVSLEYNHGYAAIYTCKDII